jgi:hypothetical protein
MIVPLSLSHSRIQHFFAGLQSYEDECSVLHQSGAAPPTSVQRRTPAALRALVGHMAVGLREFAPSHSKSAAMNLLAFWARAYLGEDRVQQARMA